MITIGCTPVGAVLGSAFGALVDPRVVFLGAAASSLAMILPVRYWLSAEALAAEEAPQSDPILPGKGS